MKYRINVIFILLFCLFLMVGCHGSQNQPKILLDNEGNTLTIDSVRYRRDEEVVAINAGKWEYAIRQMEVVGRVKEKDSRSVYLLYRNTEETEELGQAFLYGRNDKFVFGQLTYDVWFREELLEELVAPLTTETVWCEKLSETQLFRLLELYGSTELDGSLSEEDESNERYYFDIERTRLWRSVTLYHKEIPLLSHPIRFYFSARTGLPYLRCQDGRFRECPQELTETLELVPNLPKIVVVTEGDPRISELLNGVWQQKITLTPKELKKECDENQWMRDLEFRIDIYNDTENDSFPCYILKGYYHPKTGTPWLFYREGKLREIPKEIADSLGL